MEAGMVSGGAEPEHLLARVNALQVILQALMLRLREVDVAPTDMLLAVKADALHVAGRFQESHVTSQQVGGARVEEAIEEFFRILRPR
jgi:hypothetical protein